MKNILKPGIPIKRDFRAFFICQIIYKTKILEIIKTKIILLLMFSIASFSIYGQVNRDDSISFDKNILTGEILLMKNDTLDKIFINYDIFKINLSTVHEFVNKNTLSFTFKLNNIYNWNIELEVNELRSENYRSVEITPEGNKVISKNRPITYKGLITSPKGGIVRLSIDT